MHTLRGKIMIFDDDEDILAICKYFLSDKGWQVHTYATTQEFISLVTNIMPDIILMDNWLPGGGGILSTQQLKSSDILKHIPVILFSANNEIDRLAKEAGADGILAKPFDFETLEYLLAENLR